MKKWLFLFCVFLFACKKNDNEIPLIEQNQKPISISIYDVDLNTNAESMRFAINYFYNDSNRIDSIKIANDTYTFDYTSFLNNNKIILKQSNLIFPYDVITYENVFYNLISHQRINNVNDTSKNVFQYDSINRLKHFQYSYNNSANDFFITQTYKRDTVFVQTEFINNACVTNDTIKNSINDMSKNLPYLLFTKLDNPCGIILFQNILSALPLSSFTNKLPSKIIRNNNQVDYTYEYDDTDRVTKVILTKKNRASAVVERTTTIKIYY